MGREFAEVILPTAPYWPLRPGSRITYRAYIIEGYFHSTTFELDINKREVDPNQPVFQRTVVALPQLQIPAVATVHSTPPHVPTINDDWSQASPLYQMLWKPRDGKAFIGEAGGNHSLAFPPDPILTLDPVVGERITVDVAGYDFAADGTATPATLRSVYATISNTGHWWVDKFPDTVRTGLSERPGEPGWRYNNLWARDIGPVDMWWIYADENGHGKGFEWQVVNLG